MIDALFPRSHRWVWLALIALLFVPLIYWEYLSLPPGIDWRDTYRPAAQAVLSGESPYSAVPIFFAAPWSLIPLLPYAFMPEPLGRALLFLVGLGTFSVIAYRLGAKPITLTVFLLSPPVIHCLLNSNIEWLALLGVILPPQIGLFFVVIKPQIGIGIAIFWLIQSWRKGGWREAIRVFAPVTLALLVSFALYGLWPLRFRETLALSQNFNASLWPMSIPVGLTLLVASLRKHNIRMAMASSPCLSPYVLLHAWVGALASLMAHPAEMVVAVVGMWVLVVMRGIG